MFFRLIKTDFKRITGYGIYMIIAAFVIMSVLLGLAIKADDILYSDDDQTPLNIGIVMSADSKMARMAYSTIEDMDSYRTSCVFTEISDKGTALSMLEDKKLFAVIYVPDNIISDIMDGTNTPVEVYYSDMHSINTFVLNDLFRSTSSMLGISQAAIYSVQAIGRDMELPAKMQEQLSNDINAMFLSQVLNRASTFAVNEINAVRAVSTTTFYTCAAVVLMMMLSGSVFIPFIIDIPNSYKTRLRSYGIGAASRTFSSFLSVFTWEYLLYMTVYTALSAVSIFTDQLQIHMTATGLLFGLAVSVLVTLLIIIACFVPAGTNGCVLFLTVTAMILAYLSGFFVPEAMLPNFAKEFCQLSPFNRLVHFMCQYFS